MPSHNHNFSCKMCLKTFSKPSDIDKHLKLHDELLVHMKSSHVRLERTKIYRCDLCTRGFLNRDEYRKHHKQYFSLAIAGKANGKNEDNNNKIDKPYECEECGKRFVMESTLETHSIVHRPFPYVCKCGIGYYKRCDLDGHRKLVHPNIKSEEVKTEIKYKTDSENDDSEYEERPSKARPRLKATLSYKQTQTKLQKKKSSTTPKIPHQRYVLIDGLRVYKCEECPQEFTDRKKFYQHTAKHKYDGIKRAICEMCNKAFQHQDKLRVHMRVHTLEKPYKCDECLKSFSQISSLTLHKMRHKGVKNHQCDYCNKGFYTIHSLNLHRRTHTGEKPFECETCGKCFSDPSAFQRHKIIHTGLKPHKCAHCPKSFSDSASLYRHRQLHLNLSIPCKLCGKKFPSRSYMLNHIGREHSKETEFKCHDCEKWFDKKSYLVIHMTSAHINIRCKECKRCFFSGTDLKRHKSKGCIRCPVCNLAFPYRNKLEQHKIMCHKPKHEVKLLDCNSCVKQFANNIQLTRHMRTHEAKLLYTCDNCKMTFTKKHSLKDHIWVKHMISLYCNICLGRFCNEYELRKHKSACKPNKHTCELCEKTFTCSKSLNTHLLLSHGPRNLECDGCGAKFISRAHLQKHIRICSTITKKSN